MTAQGSKERESGNCRPFVVGIGGGTASGKSYLCRTVQSFLPHDDVSVFPVDYYYFDRSNLPINERAATNFDHPDALEIDLCTKHLRKLKHGTTTEIPVYDFTTHSRRNETLRVVPKRFILVEGILVLHFEELRRLFDLSVFVEAPPDLRFERRLRRDMAERDRTAESVKKQWETTVEPMYGQFCEPSKQYADTIIQGVGRDSSAAFVRDLLKAESAKRAIA